MKLNFALIALAAASVAAAGSVGPQGVWMLTDGDNATDAMIQGGSVQTFGQAAFAELQYPIAWNSNFLGSGSGAFMTVGRDQNGRGGVYDINHNVIGNFGNFTSFTGQHLDGTLDTAAQLTYASNFTTGDVVQYTNAYFDAPSVSIYNAGAGNLVSITYNAATGTLFLGGDGTITEITTGGAFVNSFTTPDSWVRSLAYDASDNTMWYLSFSGTDIVQVNAAGSEVGRTTVNLGGNYWGGEIAPVPEPATFVALGLGLAALLIRRKK
ncbi:MAG: PEP-CTERM sorting domain-containing protein [Armatimonadota bacterium]|nr:PEP-CTERM sorting domain-containing protein [Armatimonadota bacterium]